jgi:hypothetical protein
VNDVSGIDIVDCTANVHTIGLGIAKVKLFCHSLRNVRAGNATPDPGFSSILFQIFCE